MGGLHFHVAVVQYTSPEIEPDHCWLRPCLPELTAEPFGRELVAIRTSTVVDDGIPTLNVISNSRAHGIQLRD